MGNDSVDIKSSINLSMDWNISILQEFQKSNFSSIAYWNKFGLSHLDIGAVVIQDSLLEDFDSCLFELTVKDCIWSGIPFGYTFKIELFHLHLTSGENVALSDDEIVRFSHLFKGVLLSKQDPVLSVHSHY